MKPSLVGFRLRAQLLDGGPTGPTAPTGPTGAAVVAHLGAVQSQLHDMSLWALSRRTGRTRAELSKEFDDGAFVRTHVMRPTWHHVLPADLPDLLALTAQRVRRSLDHGSRESGLPPADREKAAETIVAAVRAHGPLTRTEIAPYLVKAGLPGPAGTWTTQAVGHSLMEAEQTGLIGSGPMRGKQHTYRALDLPPSSRTPDERLAWLARTYARGHGPVTPEDFAWWTWLPVTVARHAFVLAGLRPVTVAGIELFTDDDAAPQAVPVPAAMLLANFDELISYRRDPADWGPQGTDAVLRAQGLLFLDGALAGSWTRAESAKGVTVTVTTPLPLTRRHRAALESETEAYGRFAGLQATLQFSGR